MCVDASAFANICIRAESAAFSQKAFEVLQTGDQSSTWQRKGETEGAKDNLKPSVC